MTSRIRISASTRLILAMFRLIAGVEENIGQAIIDIIKEQYPDQDVDVGGPSTVGRRAINIAKKELRGDYENALDAVQDYLAYVYSRSEPLTIGEKFADPARGLNAMLSNIRKRAMSRSFQVSGKSLTKDERSEVELLQEKVEDGSITEKEMKRLDSLQNRAGRKQTKSLDQAFGKRSETSDSPAGGEGQIPTGEDNPLGRALDDQAALKRFMDVMDENIPFLMDEFTDEEKALFDLVWRDGEGGFSSDISENMNQASALAEKHPDIYERNKKRWSGFVNGLRKKVLSKIESFIEEQLSGSEYDAIYEMFFSDTSPKEVEKKELEKLGEKEAYQRGIDERKIATFKAMEESGELSEKDRKSFENLKKKLSDQGVDVDAIQADFAELEKKKKAKEKRDKRKMRLENESGPTPVSSMLVIAARVASAFHP